MLFTGEKMHELSPQWLKRICSCASIKPVSVWQESIWYITLWFRCMGGLVLQKNLSRVPSGAICDKEDAQCWLNWCVYSGYFYPYAFRFLSYTCYISIVSSFETSGFNITGSPLDDLFGYVIINWPSPITPHHTKSLPCLQSYPGCLDEITVYGYVPACIPALQLLQNQPIQPSTTPPPPWRDSLSVYPRP